ncbi:hypothetical protein BG023_111647 [Porphyrobacter sp. LM 6]|nr:hypothetical protein BG023_111647 [Porphyrobacter sp. LM 6]
MIIFSKCSECCNERLLREVYCFLGISNRRSHEPEDFLTVACQQFPVSILTTSKCENRKFAVAPLAERESHCTSGVSAFVTVRSNRAAWSGVSTARMAKRCSSVSFCSSPIT